eukprot:scaffold23924_cov74-Phaeocystis_antarctica.AAC.5
MGAARWTDEWRRAHRLVASVILKPLPLAFFSWAVQSSRPTPEPMGAVLKSPSIACFLPWPNVPGLHVDWTVWMCLAKTPSFMRSGAAPGGTQRSGSGVVLGPASVSMGLGPSASASTCAIAPTTSRGTARTPADRLTPLLWMSLLRADEPAFVSSLSIW